MPKATFTRDYDHPVSNGQSVVAYLKGETYDKIPTAHYDAAAAAGAIVAEPVVEAAPAVDPKPKEVGSAGRG